MDDNTRMVLITLITGVITPLVVFYVSLKQGRKIDGVNDKVGGVDKKVDEYHKEVNGKMGLLLETTKDLATSQEKARADAEDKGKKK